MPMKYQVTHSLAKGAELEDFSFHYLTFVFQINGNAGWLKVLEVMKIPT